MNYHRATVNVAGGAGTGGDEVTENDQYSEDARMLLCLVLMGLSFLTGFLGGSNLEKSYTMRILHSQIEELEAEQ